MDSFRPDCPASELPSPLELAALLNYGAATASPLVVGGTLLLSVAF
jgi:hypothetical protein